MGKLKNNQNGFSAVEAVLILVIVGLIGFVGWYVWHAKSNTDKALTVNNSNTHSFKKKTPTNVPVQTTDPYAGWKSSTMTYEKLTFKYPSSWTLADQSTAAGKHDDLTLTASDGFSFNFIDGIQNGGDSLPLASDSPVSLTFLSKPGYMVFVHPKVAQADGPSVPDISTVGSAVFLTDATNQTSEQADKNVIGSSQYNGVNGPEGAYMFMSMGYNGKKNLSIDAAKSDPEYANAKLVIQSMQY